MMLPLHLSSFSYMYDDTKENVCTVFYNCIMYHLCGHFLQDDVYAKLE